MGPTSITTWHTKSHHLRFSFLNIFFMPFSGVHRSIACPVKQDLTLGWDRCHVQLRLEANEAPRGDQKLPVWRMDVFLVLLVGLKGRRVQIQY